MNYIKQVVEMFGLKWDEDNKQSEVFEIEGVSNKFRFCSNGLCHYSKWAGKYMYGDDNNWLFVALLCGKNKIKENK